jgi:hypothetical protein
LWTAPKVNIRRPQIMPRERLRKRSVLTCTDVVDRAAYIDSVWVICKQELAMDDFKELRSTLLRAGEPSKARLLVKRRHYINPHTGELFFFYVLAIHQPARATIKLLAKMQKATPHLLRLHRLDMALDLMTSTRKLAEKVHARLKGCFLPLHRSVSLATRYRATTYYGNQRMVGTRVVVYSDKTSKATGALPCAHIEYRIRGASRLKSAGYAVAADLLELDHAEFWSKKLRFFQAPHRLRLQRILENRARREGKTNPLGYAQARMRHLLRLSLDEKGVFVFANYDHLLRQGIHPRPSELYTKLDNYWAVPAPENALWR